VSDIIRRSDVFFDVPISHFRIVEVSRPPVSQVSG
jgi:hypothetical protein